VTELAILIGFAIFIIIMILIAMWLMIVGRRTIERNVQALQEELDARKEEEE